MILQGGAWLVGFMALLFAVSSMPVFLHRIPSELQAACALLALLAAALLVRMLLERRRAMVAYEELLQALGRFAPAGREERIYGVPQQRMDEVLEV